MQIDTYRFDAHDGYTDASSCWTSEANAFDASDATYASSSSTGNLDGKSTTAPGNGTDAILLVRVRAKGAKASFLIYNSTRSVYYGAVGTGTTAGWSDWGDLVPPTGGWTWASLHTALVRIVPSSAGAEAYLVELEVSHTAATPTTATYRFDAHDGWTDADSVWTNEDKIFDADIGTPGYATVANHYLDGIGTSAPSSGADIIDLVRIQLRAKNDAGEATYLQAIVDGVVLGQVALTTTGSPQYSAWQSLTAPAGGWTWAKVHAMASKMWSTGGSIDFYGTLVEVTSEASPIRPISQVLLI